MADLAALTSLMQRGRDAAQPVGWRAGQWIRWPEFAAEVAGWQAAFARQPGLDWALYHEDALHFAASLLGAWQAGKRVWLATDTQPQTVARLVAQVDGLAGQWPAGAGAMVLGGVAPGIPAGFALLSPRLDALRLHTSGSTGVPVAIPKRLDQLDAELAHLAACWPALASDALVCASVSPQHIYGLLFRVLWPLCSGRPLQAERLESSEQLASAAERSGRPCVLVSSPALLSRLAAPERLRAVAPMLAAIYSSGGALPDAALPDCQHLLGRTPIEVYGSSETGGIGWRQRRADASGESPWQALPGVQWRLVDAGADALIAVRSDHLEDPASWWPTSDRASACGSGFVLHGRADRIVKIAEKRLSLTALERALLDSRLVLEARALAPGGTRHGLAVVAVPSTAGWALWEAGGRQGLAQALLAGLQAQFEAALRPRRWRFVDALPIDAQGKSTQALLEARLDPRLPEARLLSCVDGHARWRVRVEAASPWLKGHFPDLPILPGVTQIDWVLRLARARLAVPAGFRGIQVLKFQQVIRPGMCVDLDLRFDAARQVLAFALTSSAGAHASGRLLLGPRP